jgi:hypothetical protein
VIRWRAVKGMVEQTHSARWNPEGPQLGMQALWRLAIWGGLAAFALFVAIISAYSNAVSQRQAASMAAGQGAAGQGAAGQRASGQEAAQPYTSAGEAAARAGEEEARRLTQTVRSLAADRDQLLTRVALLERNLDGVTGSIKRERTANPQQVPLQLPLQAPQQAQQQIPLQVPPQVPQQAPQQNLAAATGPAPIMARPEAPPAPVVEAAIAPAQIPSQPPSASSASPVAAPDAGNRVAAAAPSLMRVVAPPEPLAAAGGLGVDVGGAANYDGLRTLWHSTRNSDPALLEELFPVVAVRENGKTRGVDLRLIVGPIADAEAAARLCSTLSAAHHYCQPVAFEGQRLSLIDTASTKSAPAPSHRSAPSASAQQVVPETPHFRGVYGK